MIFDIEENVQSLGKLRILWDSLSNVAMNPDTECMEEQFLHFPVGTHRTTIWRWFEGQHPKFSVGECMNRN